MQMTTTSPRLWAIKHAPGYFHFCVPHDGKLRRFKCKSEQEGKKLYRAWLVEQAAKSEQATKIEQEAHSVEAFIKAHWESTKINMAATTRALNESTLTKHVYRDKTFMALSIHDITVADVKAFVDGVKGSSSTKARALKLVKSFFRAAVEDELLSKNPIRLNSAHKPKATASKIVALEPKEEAALLAYAVGDPFWDLLVTLALDSGMRLGELLGLHWDSVYFDRSEIYVHRTADTVGSEVILKNFCKSPASIRRIKVSETTLALLQSLLRQGNARSVDSSGLVFPDPDTGLPWNRHKLTYRWRNVLKAAGIGHVGMHALRHTMACRLLREGCFITAVSRRLGHSKPSITLDRYSNSIPTDDAVLASSFDQTARKARATHGPTHGSKVA